MNISKQSIYIIVGFIYLMALSLGISTILTASHGEYSKDMVVSKYVRGIETGDENTILSLIPRTHVIQDEIYQIVSLWGKGELRDRNIEYRSDFGNTRSTVIICGKYVTEQYTSDFQDRIFLQQINGRWFLILGHHRDGLNSTAYPPAKP